MIIIFIFLLKHRIMLIEGYGCQTKVGNLVHYSKLCIEMLFSRTSDKISSDFLSKIWKCGNL